MSSGLWEIMSEMTYCVSNEMLNFIITYLLTYLFTACAQFIVTCVLSN